MQRVTFIALFFLALTAFGEEETWYPSKYGKNDTLGAINNLSADGVVKAAQLVKLGKTYPLGVVTGWETPAYPPRTYSITVLQGGDGTGTPVGSNKATGNDDLMFTWVGIGSQIDGLGHMGINHVYYNGMRAEDIVSPKGLKELSVDKLPPIVGRGILIDMTRYYETEMLEAGTAYNSKEIQEQASAQGIEIEKGDVVLFYTGWMNLQGVDNTRLMSGAPGLGMDGAEFLAEKGVVAVGSDTWGLEAVPAENPEEIFPVHPLLLAKHGIYILENMDVRELAKDEGWEFMFVLGQPRFEGSVQAVINPVAIR